MAKLFAWGDNWYGRVGDGTTTDRSSPVQIGDMENWANVDAHYSSFAIKEDGTLWAWGKNENGVLGDGTTIAVSSPVQIGLNSIWSDVKTHGYHTLAKKVDNTLWAWGYNGYGQLGDTTTENRSSPVQIGIDSDWAEFSTGEGFSAAIKENGTLWAWGKNYFGQFGDNTVETFRSSPVQLASDTNWSQLSCGEYSVAAIKKNGTLFAWGANYYGVLGDGTTDHRSSPVQIGSDTNWKQVSVSPESGNSFALAIKEDGSLWSWGNNIFGQLGDNSVIQKSSPAQVGSDKNWSFVTTGYGVSYAIKTDGTLWAWGFNYTGNYGDETDILRSSPIQIASDKVGWKDISGYFHALGVYGPTTIPTKSCSNISCSTPAFKCYVGVTDSCACARWKFYTAQCTRIQQSLGICSGTSGAYVPAITVCNQKLF